MARLVVSTRGHSAWEAQAQQCSWWLCLAHIWCWAPFPTWKGTTGLAPHASLPASQGPWPSFAINDAQCGGQYMWYEKLTPPGLIFTQWL
jgi:hypothetical protein